MRLLVALRSNYHAPSYLAKNRFIYIRSQIVRLKLSVYEDRGKNQTHDNAENDYRIIRLKQTQLELVQVPAAEPLRATTKTTHAVKQ